MQTPQAVPPVPAPPVPPGAPIALLPNGVPLSMLSSSALNRRGDLLSEQLTSATGRRDALAQELQTAPPWSRPGLQERLNVLDKRLVQLESDIAVNGQLKVQAAARSAPGAASSGRGSGPFTGFPGTNMNAIAIVFTVFVLGPIAVATAIRILRRAPEAPRASRESELRMERVEQAVDAIAVEVERISEGQRFITQVLSKSVEARALGIGDAQAEVMRIPMHETVMAPVQRRGAVG